jgi:3',5'-cyclic-AMP phosphodiesterase
MRKIIIVVSALILTFIGFVGFRYFNYDLVKDVSTEATPGSSLAFAVVGDVHENIENFQIAINDMRKINSNMDLLIMNGDSVDQGLEKQYDSMKKLMKKNSSKLPEIIIKNIGNHEFFDYNIEYNSDEDVQRFINNYLDFAGEKTVYHDKWIKGYHFISLGSENGNTKDFNSVSAYISDKQLNWFEQKIGENHEPGKPIFVFLHQPVSSGSGGWVGTSQAPQIKEILSKYPEAIVFTSHTHAYFQNSNVTLNVPYTTAHTGAVHYTFKPGSDGKRERVYEGYGLYVEVFGNKVVIKGRDFTAGSWMFEKEISK